VAGLPKVVRSQAAAFDDALEGADRDRLAAVLGNDDLPPVGMAPFLVATALAHAREAMLPENPDDIIGVADRKAVTQGKATSRSLPFFGMSTGVESNHNARASLALATASSSVSPALAHPGKSGKTADQRPACSSYSSSTRNFMVELYPWRTWLTTTTQPDSGAPIEIIYRQHQTQCLFLGRLRVERAPWIACENCRRTPMHHGGRTLSEPGIEIWTPSNDLAPSRRREPSATEVPGCQWDALKP
jgi:hypothetical protein